MHGGTRSAESLGERKSQTCREPTRVQLRSVAVLSLVAARGWGLTTLTGPGTSRRLLDNLLPGRRASPENRPQSAKIRSRVRPNTNNKGE